MKTEIQTTAPKHLPAFRWSHVAPLIAVATAFVIRASGGAVPA